MKTRRFLSACAALAARFKCSRYPLGLSRMRGSHARSLGAVSHALFACSLLGACIGGTGTDTDNGITGFGTAVRVVDADGKPLAGVTLSLHRPDFHPDSSAAEDLVLDAVKTPATDAQGYVRFNLIQPDKYVVEGSLGGAVILFDTLPVADVRTLAAFTLVARPGGAVKGKVRLASGLKVVSGSIFIRGTSRRSAIDTAGGYDLGSLPMNAGTMSIGLTYRAIAVEARVAEQKDSAKGVPVGPTTSVKPVFTCREVAVDSAARLTSTAGTAKSLDAFGNPTFASADTVKLDTARLNAVNRSCDSLSGGTVVAVRTPVPASGVQTTGDSATTNLIAVDPANGHAMPSERLQPPAKLVPLNGCVANPGTVTTTYEVRLQSTATGADVHVGDVAEACLE